MDEGIEGHEGASLEESVSPPAAPESLTELPALAPLAGSPVLSPSSPLSQLGTECAEAWPAAVTPELTESLPANEPGRRTASHRPLVVVALVAVLVAVAGALVAVGSDHHPARPAAAPGDPAVPILTTSQIARLVIPAVVDINTVNQTASGVVLSAATGMIVSSGGYIVTNNHVVEAATSIRVSVDGYPSSYPAVFVGADPAVDVAVIKVSGLRPLRVVHFGDSSAVSVHMPVVAIGNALGRGGRPAVTTGDLEGIGRSIVAGDDLTSVPERLHDLLETSALIREGNSGGPLLDGHAEVIGMDTAAEENGVRGFAVPSNEVALIVADIVTRHTSPGIILGVPAFLGIVGLAPVTRGRTPGVPVGRVLAGEPAVRAGIRPGDVIVALDGHPTPTVAALRRLVTGELPGSVVRVRFASPTGLRTVTLRLADGPAP